MGVYGSLPRRLLLMMLVKAGRARRVALAVTMLFELGKVGSIRPRHHGQKSVGRRAQAVGHSDGARQ